LLKLYTGRWQQVEKSILISSIYLERMRSPLFQALLING
jgi:hypothetical protein